MNKSRPIWGSILSVLFVSFCSVQAVEFPPPVEIGKGAVVAGGQIFAIENKPTKECHASTIAETPSGLVTAWFAGTRERDPDVGIWLSRQVEGSWTEPVEVVNGVQSMNLRYPCWNPVLFQVPDGPLLLFYKVGPNPREWWGMLTRSEDGGKTWSWPTKLGEHWAVGHLLGPVKNKPVLLADGSLLCPTSTDVELSDDDMRWRVHFEVTRDWGKTWDVIGPIHDGIEFDSIQPSILTYANGDMQILCRSMQQVVSQSWSSDGGRTWTNMAASDLPNPSAGTDAVTLQDGRQLLVYNHSTRKSSPPSRQILNVALSDDGHDWEVALTLEREAKPRPADGRHWGEYSYPAVIQASDGLVHITYTYNREGIKHLVVDPTKL